MVGIQLEIIFRAKKNLWTINPPAVASIKQITILLNSFQKPRNFPNRASYALTYCYSPSGTLPTVTS